MLIIQLERNVFLMNSNTNTNIDTNSDYTIGAQCFFMNSNPNTNIDTNVDYVIGAQCTNTNTKDVQAVHFSAGWGKGKNLYGRANQKWHKLIIKDL